MKDSRTQEINWFTHELKALGKDISILKSIRWHANAEQEVRACHFKEIPKINYLSLTFDVAKKMNDIKKFISMVEKSVLDTDHKMIFINRAECLLSVVLMLNSRGTKEFGIHSQNLYGSSFDYKENNISDILFKLKSNYLRFHRHDPKVFEKTFTASEVVSHLKTRLKNYFPGEDILIKSSSKLNSEASTGKNYIKINKNYLFSLADIRIFEVHEAHVHLATNLNMHHQINAPWLGIHTPKATKTQEGLALFMEFVTQAMTLPRLENIINRSKACELAESGANFLEVCEYFRTNGLSEHDCFKAAQRVFRGTDLAGGSAFTKDLSYVLGFIDVYKFIENALSFEDGHLINLLFCGKTTLDEMELIKKLNLKGEVHTPQYIPEIIDSTSILQMKMLFMSLLDGIELVEAQSIPLIKTA